jgi:hypothetical protein
MNDHSLLKSNFIGRDGFRWWLGQVAPKDDQEKQSNGEGWGNRVKVRIMGYHSPDQVELPNKDLPWAQIMLPTTTGSGGQNYAVNHKITPGDVVIGFFLDGDNAQIPCILGTFGRTSDTKLAPSFQSPFVPFSGYTDAVKNPKPTGRLIPDETSETRIGSQKSPRLIPPDQVSKLNSTGAGDEIAAFTGVGKTIVFADTCEDTATKTIKSEVDNLLKWAQEKQAKVAEYQAKIAQVAGIIKSSVSWIVGKLMEYLYNFLVGCEKKPGIIPNALKALYTSVYSAVYAASGNPAAAHQAGVKSNEFFVLPVKAIEQALPCVASAVINGLTDLIVGLLEALLNNIQQFVQCAADAFLGTLLNSVVDAIAGGLSSVLGGISSLLGGLSVIATLQQAASSIFGQGGLFDCGQDQDKCKGSVKEWVIGKGPKETADVGEVFNNVINTANSIGSLVNTATGSVEGVISGVSQVTGIFGGNLGFGSIDGCFTGFPNTCGAPTINIFGGGGSGASAIPIFGPAIALSTPYQNVQNVTNIIGAIVTDGGSGYSFPPSVDFSDNCNLGFGASGQAIIENGQVVAIVMNSTGQNYPMGEIVQTSVSDVIVINGGTNYSDGDTAVDNFGNTYTLSIENGVIVSAKPDLNNIGINDKVEITVESNTGTGALLKPVFGSLNQDFGDPIKQIDCVY